MFEGGSMSKGILDVTPVDGITRCDICHKPFIYGMVKTSCDHYTIVEKSPDPGACQPDGRWATRRSHRKPTTPQLEIGNWNWMI